MKRSTKIISAVVLTIGVAGGATAYAKNKFGNPEKRATHMVNYISDELSLDATQEQNLVALKDQLLVAKNLMTEQWGNTRDEVDGLLAADTFDQALALEMISSRTQTIDTIAPETVAALGQFLDSLDAEQKADVIEFLNRRGHGHRGGWGRH